MPAAKADFLIERVSDCLNIQALSRFILTQKEAAFQAMAEAIQSQPVKAAMVDVRFVPGPYTFMDYYQLGEMAGRYLRMVPIAVLAGPEQVDPDRIGKVVAQNRGANLEVFTDLVEAQAWLKQYLLPGL